MTGAGEHPAEVLLEHTLQRAVAYLRELPERRVAPAGELAALRAELGGPLPESGESAATVLARIDGARTETMANAGPRFFGFGASATGSRVGPPARSPTLRSRMCSLFGAALGSFVVRAPPAHPAAQPIATNSRHRCLQDAARGSTRILHPPADRA